MKTGLALTLSLVTLAANIHQIKCLNIVIPGGTGPMGRLLSSTMHTKKGHKITILTRNAFLASAPNRVSGAFGWLGRPFLDFNPSVKLRDWDGGDLLDIVGCDWMGWQEDSLKGADVVVNLVGGYTEQRVMACERIARESLTVNPTVKHVLVTLTDEDLGMKLKIDTARKCEEMMTENFTGAHCLRVESNDLQGACDQIVKILDEL